MYHKTSRIEKCTLKSEWVNPINNSIIYYHELKLENGDIGNCGTLEKYPNKLSVNSPIHYTMDGNKIKLANITNETPVQTLQKPIMKSQKTFSQKKQDEFLGYAWSYAKDLIIAGKNMNDVEELNKIARYIYEEIGKMLNNNNENKLF